MSVIEHYATTSYPYDYHRGPSVVHSREDARGGANCSAITRLVAIEHGFVFPSTLDCAELQVDQTYTYRLANFDDVQVGDLGLFGAVDSVAEDFKPYYDPLTGDLLNWEACPSKHVVTLTGKDQVLHTSDKVGRPKICSLSELMADKRYKSLQGILRLRWRNAQLCEVPLGAAPQLRAG